MPSSVRCASSTASRRHGQMPCMGVGHDGNNQLTGCMQAGHLVGKSADMKRFQETWGWLIRGMRSGRIS